MTPEDYKATTKPRRNDNPEFRLHRSIVDYLFLALPEGCGVQWEHYPAGGQRNLFVAMKLKDMGAKSGRLDLRFRWNDPIHHPQHHTAWVELKDKSSLSDHQKLFMAECELLGDRCFVAKSRIEFYGIVARTLHLPLRAVIDDNDLIRDLSGNILYTGRTTYRRPMAKTISKKALKNARLMQMPLK